MTLTCSSEGGSPDPQIEWFRDGKPVPAHVTPGGTRDKPTLAILKITPTAADDRVLYRCSVWNRAIREDKKLEAVVSLRIEHSPVVRHTYNKVAFDIGETAVIQCKMSAYPKPKFDWFFSGRQLEEYNTRYAMNETDLGDDIHVGSLIVRDTRPEDYGDYTCRASNSVDNDDERTVIKLVKVSVSRSPSLHFLLSPLLVSVQDSVKLSLSYLSDS